MALPQLPFSSYAPHPDIPGAYNFMPANGGAPMMFAGNGTEDMRRAIDSMPEPDMRTADVSGMMPQGNINGAIQGFAAQDNAPQPTPVASDMSHAAPTVSNPLNLNQPLPPPQQPQAPAAPAESAGQEGAPSQASVPVRNYEGGTNQPQPQQASTAPDLRNLDKMYKVVTSKGGMMPSAQSIETKGGVQDPAMQKAMLENYALQSKAAEDRAEAEKLQAAGTYAQSQIAANEAGKEAEARAQRERDLIASQQTAADEYGRIMGIKQQELANASKREVDQYRMYRGNAGAAIGAALAAGLGAFGASIGHTPNFALDFIQRSIDRDVEAQRDEINRGVASKQNDIARIRDQYNVSTPIAEKLLAINLTEKAQALARKQAAMAGGQAAAEKLIGIDQGLADYRGKLLQDMQHTLYGDATVKAEEKYRAGGSSVQLTPEARGRKMAAEAYGATAENLGKGVAGEVQAEHGGLTPAQLAKQQGSAGKTNYTAQTKGAINAADAAKHQLRHTAAMAGIDINEETGEAKITDWMKFAHAQSKYSPAAAAMRAAVPEVIRGQTGAKPSLDEEHAKLEEFSNPLGILSALQENYRALKTSAETRRANTFQNDANAGGNEKQEQE